MGDLTAIGTAIATAFDGVGNVLLTFGAAGAIVVWIGGIGLPMLAIPFNQRAAMFIKGNIGWFIGGLAVLGSSGIASKVFAAAILAGKIG